jgi:hypothetical protein
MTDTATTASERTVARRHLIWNRIGAITGGLLFAGLIFVIAIGPDSSCEAKPFPFLCLVLHVFGR